MAAAGVSDGAIIIDTGIDNSGITKDARITQKLLNGLKNLIDRIGKTMGQSWQGYTRAMRESLRTSQAVNSELAQLQRRWAELNREIMAMERAGVNSDNAERYRALKEELYQVVARMRELRQAQQETSGSTETEAGSTHNLSAALLRVAGAARTAAGGLWGLVRRGISSGFHAIANAAKRAGKALAGLTKHQKQHNNSLGIGFKNILKYGLGIRSLYVLFNRLRAAVKEGFGELRKSAPEVDKALKNLKTSLTGLKGSLATAFAPILTAIEPALTTLIDLLTRAINAIGAFMAALSGASFYYVANSVSNVANGVEDVGNAASNASGDVKALKRQLAGFDELNILSQSSGGGGGGSGSGGGLTYTKTPIESGITDFVARLRSMWQDADFEGIGKIIADKINGVFEKAKALISWDNLKDKVERAVSAITGVLNSMLSQVDWKLIGQTFGEGFNTVVNTMHLAVSQFNWGEAGTAFATTVNSLILTVKWKTLGKAIGESINGVLETLYNAVLNFNWGEAGAAFSTAVNALLLTVKWSTLTKAFGQSINGVIEALQAAIRGFEWGEAGKTFAQNVNLLLVTVNWTNLGKAFSEGINSALEWLYNAALNFSWGEAGTKFATTVNSFLTTVNWTTLGKALAKLIGGPLESLKEAVLNFEWGDTGIKFADAINAFFEDPGMWADAGTIVSESIKGLFTWGKELLDNLDAEQIADDIRSFLGTIDWGGIASAIWGFAVSAVRKIGNLFLALIFGPDYKDKTKVQQEIEDYISGLTAEPPGGRNFGVNFGLNLYFEPEMEAFNTLADAITKALQTGDFKVPVDLDVPKESVYAAYLEYVKEWNLIHPEAPITPILPENVGQLMQSDLDSKGVTLSEDVDVDPTIDEAAWQQEWDDFAGHPFNVDTTVSIVNDAPKWAKNIKTWLNTALKGDNIPTFAAQLKNDAATWWDNAKKWWGKAVKSGGQLGTFSVGVKDNRTGWWDKVKKWWGKAVGKETVEFNVKPANNSKSWWDSVKSWWDGIKKTLGFNVSANGGKFAGGGYVTNSGRFGAFASGGAVRGSVASWWNTLPKYASGTRSAHGTMFLAGEAGPEIVGHVGGRTEVLNKSQLASTMFSAVENGMLAAASRIEFHMPAMASGTVLPYDVSAQIAKTGQDIMTAMDANNEDLIQTIISVAGQIVNALGGLRAAPAVGGMTAQQVINALNQRTQMFGESPLQGV